MSHLIIDKQAGFDFVQSQLAHVEQQVYKQRLPEIRYRSLNGSGLIPIDTTANPWSKTIVSYAMESVGKAKWTTDRATEINVVGTGMSDNSTPVYMADIGYDYGMEEVEHARMLGHNLTADKAMVAFQVSERFIDTVAFEGDASKNFQGLLNHSAVTAAGATTGGWDTATETQILADVNDVIMGIYNATNSVAIADTLLLAPDRFAILASRQLVGTTMTLLEYIRKNNAYTALTNQPLDIRTIRGLETAGVGGVSRMVAYRNDPTVLKLHIPMPHRFLPLEVKGLLYQVPGIFRVGGLDIRLPKEVRYADGI